MTDTETIDRLFLELSQFTRAKTARDIRHEQVIARVTKGLNDIVEIAQEADVPAYARLENISATALRLLGFIEAPVKVRIEG